MTTSRCAPARASRPLLVLAIDWPRLLEDLAHVLGEPDTANQDVRVPLGGRLLARELGVRYGTLRGWLEGCELKHQDGEVLIERWCALTGKDRAFVPRVRRSLTAPQR